MTNKEYLDSLDPERRAIANNILANENSGMGVHDVNSLPKSTWDRIMRDTEALATGGEVSNPSATTESIKAQREKDANAFTNANLTTLEEMVDEANKDLKDGVTGEDAEAQRTAAEKVKNITVYNSSDQAAKNDEMVKAGNQESEEIVSEEKEEAVVDPTEYTNDHVLSNLLKIVDPAGNKYLTQDENGDFVMSERLTEDQFYAALGDDAKKSIKTKNILTAISVGLGLLGMPAPNLGKMYENFTGKNYKELYEEYLTQDSLLREGLNEAFVNAYDIYLTGASKRGDKKNEVLDKDFQILEEKDYKKEFNRRLDEQLQSGKIEENLKVSLQAKINDLEQEQQEFMYELQSKLEVAKNVEMWKVISGLTNEELAQLGLKIKKADPNNALTAEELKKLTLNTIADITKSVAGGLTSDKKTKSFISGAKLFGKRR